jgi:gamma-glutamylcyclotransferase (GGCT)/AIG2-like uncharacterized protein YtfP
MEGQQYLGGAVTLPAYRLLDLGWYPGLAEAVEDGVPVQGEVWEVDAQVLRALDDYEGTEYVRKVIHLASPMNGEPWEAVEAYLLCDPDWSRPDAGVVWMGG